MPQRTGFFDPEDPEDPDREYFAADLAAFLGAHHPDGVLRGYGDELAVSAVTSDSGTIRLRVGTGLAMIHGFFVESYGQGTDVDLEPPDASPRIDAIVARWTTSSRAVLITYHKGTPAAVPEPPTLTDTATEKEVLIRYYRVNPGDTGSVSSPARFSGTPTWSQAPWSRFFAPLASPDFSGSPTVGGQQILHSGLTPRVAYVDIDRQTTLQDLPTSGPAPMMVLHDGFTIPSWANRVSATVTVSGLFGLSSTSEWRMWLRIDGLPNNTLGFRPQRHWRPSERDWITLQGSVAIPTALKGASRALILQGEHLSGGGLRRDSGTFANGFIQFRA